MISSSLSYQYELKLFCDSVSTQPQVKATIYNCAIELATIPRKPVGRSLNPAHKIKPLILEMIFKKTGRTPAQLYPKPGELHEYLTGPMSIQDRKIWYLSKSKYRNNFEVRNNYERQPSRK